MRLLIPLLALTLAADAAAPFLEKVDLFDTAEGKHKIYHIPGIVVTAKGTAIAWCEARKHTGGDWDAIELIYRRSTDDGKTWSEPAKFPDAPGLFTKNPMAMPLKGVKPEDITYNNPVLIADRDGTVHGLFCVEYMRCFYTRSSDDGVTWSTPIEITSAFEKFRQWYDWKVLATGPDHGIQLKNGRLLVPVWLSLGTGGNAHRPSEVATIYSDDGGKTWQGGEIAVRDQEPFLLPNETAAIELADGTVMLNTRSESKAHRRIITASPDGATGWSAPKFHPDLLEPICMASMVRYSGGPTGGGKNRILFCNPDNLTRADAKEEPGKNRDRRNLTIKLSYDEGQSWRVSKPVEPGYSAYSDIAVSKTGTILCIYGRSDKPGFAGSKITVARCNLEWLTDGADPAEQK